MIYDRFLRAHHQQKKCFALLIDPDNIDMEYLEELKKRIDQCRIDFIFIGGSLLSDDKMDFCLSFVKEHIQVPTVIFPGNELQVNSRADGILFLSLISSRNPDLLIGKHVIAAPYLRRSHLEVIPTGYMLIDGGRHTTVSYMSQSIPIPRDKHYIAQCTASAGELLGLRVIFMDAGSGACEPVDPYMIREVKKEIDIPLIVGGGIKTAEQAHDICEAGADIIVVGNAIEKNPDQILEMSAAIHSFNNSNVMK